MIGAGIFTLPAAFARSTGVVGAIVAWCIAGSGMLMLAFVFQTLSRHKPELDAGIYAYAKAGFGNHMGFTAAFGYWVACCLAQVALLVLIKAALGQFFPAFGDGTTLVAIAAGMLYAGGAKFLLLSALLYAPGTWLYVLRAARTKGTRIHARRMAGLQHPQRRCDCRADRTADRRTRHLTEKSEPCTQKASTPESQRR